MNKNHGSESLNTSYQFPKSHHGHQSLGELEEKVVLRPESAESTDSERVPKNSLTLNKSPAKQKEKNEKEGKQRKRLRVIMNISDTKYRVVEFVGRKVLDWKISRDPESEWDIFWTDWAVQSDQLVKMKPYQKINHFPGMYSLAQKNHLGRNLMRMRKVFPQYYNFFPPTWVLPAEFVDFRAQFTKRSGKTYIIKPAASCQGRGIYLTRTWENVSQTESLVAQRYLFKPYLLDGLKFDLRIYVLLAGCDPLRIYMYEEGLARFATVQYSNPKGDNIEDMCMHLTNYAINKGNPNFVFNEDEQEDGVGHKRTLTSLWKSLTERGCDVNKLKEDIEKLIVKTFCSVQPILAHQYKSCQPEDLANSMCFEVLGFDILLDHKLKPWLIEVNHTPSFATDTPLDHAVKSGVIGDALRLMNISVQRRIEYKKKQHNEVQKLATKYKKFRLTPEERFRLVQEAQRERDKWETQNRGNYKRLYPKEAGETTEPYKEFIKEANQYYENLTGTSIKRNTKKETSNLIPFRFNSRALVAENSYTKGGAAEQSETSQNRQVTPTQNRKPAFNATPKVQIQQPSYPRRSFSTVPPDTLKLETESKQFESGISQGTSEGAWIKTDTPSDLLINSPEKSMLLRDGGPIFRIPSGSNGLTSGVQRQGSFTSNISSAVQAKVESLRPNIYPVQNLARDQGFNLRQFINRQNNTVYYKLVETSAKKTDSNEKTETLANFIETPGRPANINSSRNVFSAKGETSRGVNGQRILRFSTPQRDPKKVEASFGYNLSSTFRMSTQDDRAENSQLLDRSKILNESADSPTPSDKQSKNQYLELNIPGNVLDLKHNFADSGKQPRQKTHSTPPQNKGGGFLQPKIMSLQFDGWLRPESTSYRIKKVAQKTAEPKFETHSNQAYSAQINSLIHSFYGQSVLQPPNKINKIPGKN